MVSFIIRSGCAHSRSKIEKFKARAPVARSPCPFAPAISGHYCLRMAIQKHPHLRYIMTLFIPVMPCGSSCLVSTQVDILGVGVLLNMFYDSIILVSIGSLQPTPTANAYLIMERYRCFDREQLLLQHGRTCVTGMFETEQSKARLEFARRTVHSTTY